MRVERTVVQNPSIIDDDVPDHTANDASRHHRACSSTILFKGLKSVDRSTENPINDYLKDVGAYLFLMATLNRGVETLISSSSATIRREPQIHPLTRYHPPSATCVYRHRKLIVDEWLRNSWLANRNWLICILRYLNPIGAHESRQIGKYPHGTPSNLMSYMARIAVGRHEQLNVRGSDYPTHDGTGVRDYIQAADLALGHQKALDRLDSPQCQTVKLRVNLGHSALGVVKAFASTSGQHVPDWRSSRRPVVVALCYSDPTSADDPIRRKAERELEATCKNHWRWASTTNPLGYV